MTLWEFNNYDKKAIALTKCLELQSIIKSLEHKSIKHKTKILTKLGYTPTFKRVVWNGGVASFRWYTRLKCYRIQISASIQGYDNYTRTIVKPNYILLKSKRSRHRFHKYAYCIEVYVNV